MSASDGKAPGPGRGRGITRLLVQRDDHIGDALGLIFLEAGGDHDVIIERLREYLGPRVKILKAEVGAEQIEIETSVRRFTQEAAQLAMTAEALGRKGAVRSAVSLFRESLELDPLNVTALRGLGALLLRREDWTGAIKMLIRARESGGDSSELLYGLGRAAAALGRKAAAIAYFERACELEPDNFAVRRALADLGRKPHSTRQAKARSASNSRPHDGKP
jgi:tetratricopeptide (TPR) repeat protein